MLARFPRLIAIAIFTLLCLAWLFRGNASPSFHQTQSSSPDIKSQQPSSPKKNSSPNRVHYADVPDTTTSASSSTSIVPVPTDVAPVIKPRTPFAYVFWATSDVYACSALISIRRLVEFRTPHKVHILVTPGVSQPYRDEFESLNTTVHDIQSHGHPHTSWDDVKAIRLNETKELSLIKLQAFKMHKLDDKVRRVMLLDADQYIYEPLDSLFALPDVDLAAPRAYWNRGESSSGLLATTLMLIEPSDRVWKAVETEISNLNSGEYADTVVNRVFKDSAMVLPGAYGAVDDHWYYWYLPKWYRPEPEVLSKGMVEEYHKADLKELWRVINMHVNEDASKKPVNENGQAAEIAEEEKPVDAEKKEKRSLKKRQSDEEEEEMGEILSPEAAQREKEEADEESGTVIDTKEKVKTEDEEKKEKSLDGDEATEKSPFAKRPLDKEILDDGQPHVKKPALDHKKEPADGKKDTTDGTKDAPDAKKPTEGKKPATDKPAADGKKESADEDTDAPKKVPAKKPASDMKKTKEQLNAEAEERKKAQKAKQEAKEESTRKQQEKEQLTVEEEQKKKEMEKVAEEEKKKALEEEAQAERQRKEKLREEEEIRKSNSRLPGPTPHSLDDHPDKDALNKLQSQIYVLKYHAWGKPWEHSNGGMKKDLEDIAHKKLIEQNKEWREKAHAQCPRSSRRKDAEKEESEQGDWEQWHPVNGV